MLDLSYYNIFRPSRLCLLQYFQHKIVKIDKIDKIVKIVTRLSSQDCVFCNIVNTGRLCAQSLLTDFNPAFSRAATKAPVLIFHIDILHIDILHIDILHIDIFHIDIFHSIHSKSDKVCRLCFSDSKNLRNKCVYY